MVVCKYIVLDGCLLYVNHGEGHQQDVNRTVRQKGRKSNTDKKENQIFLIYKEIQNGAVAKSYLLLAISMVIKITTGTYLFILTWHLTLLGKYASTQRVDGRAP
jgi:hypothetical protein